jgi:hypothetical protein
MNESNLQQENMNNIRQCECKKFTRKMDDKENYETSDTMKQKYSRHGKEINKEKR